MALRRSIQLLLVLSASWIARSHSSSRDVGLTKAAQFDAVWISPHANATTVRYHKNTYTVTDIQPRTLIATAYGVPPELIFGLPGWADMKRYDILAELIGVDSQVFNSLDPRRQQLLIRSILSSHFHLTAHTATKMQPVYDMVLADEGVKLKKTLTADNFEGSRANRVLIGTRDQHNFIIANGSSLNGLTSILGFLLHRTVVNKTELSGTYNIKLQWGIDTGRILVPNNGRSDTPNMSSSVLTALREQLGLELEPTTTPLKVLVVDHVELPLAM